LHKDYKVGFFEIIQSPVKVKIPFKINISIPILNPEKTVSDSWQQEADIQGLLSTGIGHAVHFGAFATYAASFEVPVFKDFILENIDESDFIGVDFPVIRSEKNYHQLTDTEKSKINDLAAQKSIFLDILFEAKDLGEVLKNLSVYGLILRGGDEEKIGVKSFEELDDIFEILQD